MGTALLSPALAVAGLGGAGGWLGSAALGWWPELEGLE